MDVTAKNRSPASRQIVWTLVLLVSVLAACAGSGLSGGDGFGSDLDPDFSADDGCPFWSPDGRSIAFYRWFGGEPEDGIFVAAADGGSAKRVAGGHASDSLVGWLKSGELVVARQNRLYASDVSAAGPRRLTGDLEGAVLGLSPDAHYVLVARKAAVVVASISSSRGGDVPIPGIDREGYNVAWSPDASWIAYVVEGNSRRNPDQLFVVRRDGSNRRKVARGWLDDPAWSPDRRQLAYSDSWSRAGIYARSVAGGPARLVSDPSEGEGEKTQPLWSPDGQTIVHQDGGSLVAVSRDGGSRRRLTSSGGFGDECPAFSPDGRRIAFLRENGGAFSYQSALIVMNADGSDKRQVR